MLFFNSIKIKFVVTFIVASVTGSALIRRFRLFLGQCAYYVPGYFLKVLVVLTAPDQDTQHSQTVRLVQRLPSITVLHRQTYHYCIPSEKDFFFKILMGLSQFLQLQY